MKSHTELLMELDVLILNKKATSSQFKSVSKGSAEHVRLLDLMKAISREIDDIETLIKATCTATETTEILNIQPPAIPPIPFINAQRNFSGIFSIDTLTKPHFTQWNLYLQTVQHSPYCTSEWLNVISQSFGHDSIIIIARNEKNEVIGGLPLTFFNSRLFGRFAVSIPFVNYGGPITEYWNIAESLLEEAKRYLTEEQLSHIEIRTVQLGFKFPYQDKKASLILPLPKSIDQLTQQWSAKLRSQCKKAERYSPIVKTGQLELLNDFYKVFSRNMRDLGTPVYAKSFFKNILTTTLNCTILIVYINNAPVSCAFLIGHNGILEIPWASTINSANVYSANMFMYRAVLKFAIEGGFDFFDFGRSTIDAGTYKFKRQWGAEPYQHYWYYLLNSGAELPSMNPDNPKYKLAINLWKKIPISIANIVGPLIVKNIA